MKLAIVGGVLISAPFIFWELWRFVAPGLYRKERRIGIADRRGDGRVFRRRGGLRLRLHVRAGRLLS